MAASHVALQAPAVHFTLCICSEDCADVQESNSMQPCVLSLEVAVWCCSHGQDLAVDLDTSVMTIPDCQPCLLHLYGRVPPVHIACILSRLQADMHHGSLYVRDTATVTPSAGVPCYVNIYMCSCTAELDNQHECTVMNRLPAAVQYWLRFLLLAFLFQHLTTCDARFLYLRLVMFAKLGL